MKDIADCKHQVLDRVSEDAAIYDCVHCPAVLILNSYTYLDVARLQKGIAARRMARDREGQLFHATGSQ